MKRIAIPLFAATLVACYSDYYYRPAEQSNATVNGFPAAHYNVPAQAPKGDVRVSTFGLTKIEQANGDKPRFLHVRMVVANNSDLAPWTVDTREQVLKLGNAGQSRPAFANSDNGQLPQAEVPVGGQRTLDLYYPLPANLQRASRLPQFDLSWKVQTPEQLVAERTPFERIYVDYYPYYYGYPSVAFGYGPYWWYDPFYTSYTFANPVVLHPRVNLPPPQRVWTEPPAERRHF
jgi:hypothetical protein